MVLKKYVKQFFNVIYLHNIQPHFMLGGGGGFRVSYQIFKKSGLAGSQFLEGDCRKRGSDFFQQEEGVAIFIYKINNNKNFINKNVYLA